MAVSNKQRSMRDYLGLALKGVAMGSCDIVPGVSGGTMAFILGIYEELIDSIKAVGSKEFIQAVTKFRIMDALEAINWKFLLAVVGGIFFAVLTLARVLEFALAEYPTQLWAFFFGLILASILTVGRKVKQWRPILAVLFVLGAAFAYLIVGLVPAETPNAWWFLLITGAIVICGMILPGISGAFLLLLLGKYQFALQAVNDRNLVPIIFLGIGAAIGIVSFAQVLSWLFKKYHDPTVAVLMGVMAGSLRKVWPWKEDVAWLKDAAGEFIIRHGERVVTKEQNLLPPDMGAAGVAIALALVGFLAVMLIERFAGDNAAEVSA